MIAAIFFKDGLCPSCGKGYLKIKYVYTKVDRKEIPSYYQCNACNYRVPIRWQKRENKYYSYPLYNPTIQEDFLQNFGEDYRDRLRSILDKNI